MTSPAPVLQGFFTGHLARAGVSPHTIASYRDTFRLLLRYARDQAGKPPSRLEMADIDARLVGGFPDHLETSRGNSVTTRNARLAAIRSLFRYAALRCPEDALLIQRVLAVPLKRHDSTAVSFLTRAESDALLAAPDQRTALGRRDHLLLLTAIQTGLRVSELTSLTCADAHLDAGPHLRCTGKGRKQRCTPLTRPAARLLRQWIADRNASPGDPLFPTRAGGRLSRDAVAGLLARHLPTARQACPSLEGKHVTPHTLRHSAAMALRHSGIDLATIALWLGHSTIRSTDIYMHADLAIKEQALERTAPADAGKPGRYKPGDSLLAFLENL